MPDRGFLPCFSNYRYDKYPIDKVFANSVYVNKVKCLLTALVDSRTTSDLRDNGLGGHIQPIRPVTKEDKEYYRIFDNPNALYRIDYGDNPFRGWFTISNVEKVVHIRGFETDHRSYNGKVKRY